MEVSAFMKEQLKEQRDHDEKIRKEMEVKLEKLEAQKKEADEKMEQMRETSEACSVSLQCLQLASAMSCVSEGQLEALQARLDALHQAKLLTDDEVFKLEDCVSEFIECRSSLAVAVAEIGAAAEQVKKLVGLSEGVSKDGMLARQLRRRFV